ncbi:MAG: SDR family oxidoreductase [Candidatus Nanopelagicales bacterium]
MNTVLFTGYPGFLGSALLPLVLEKRAGAKAVCVVQERFMPLATKRLAEQTEEHPALAQRVELVMGDITQPGLGLDAPIDDITEVFHLAAVYDLAVPAELAYHVNVEGTKHVIDLCRSASNLERLQYVSTCYVSGSHPAQYYEDELDTGQSFLNHYEHTKFEAERLVRAAMADGLPATIYRPGIVVGDSTTGDTQKYDGPYFLAQFLMKQPKYAAFPNVTDPDKIKMCLVPRDFVVGAIDQLSTMDVAIGKTYALSDPNPPSIREVVETFGGLLHKEIVWLRVPLRFTQVMVGLPGVEKLVGFPEESLAYLSHPTVYDTTNTETDLRDTGLTCPAFADYAPTMIEFMKLHPDVSSAAMV